MFNDNITARGELIRNITEPEPSVDFAANLEAISFLEMDEGEIGNDFGLYHAQFILEHPEEIPHEWMALGWIVFPGTVWRINMLPSAPDGSRYKIQFYAPYLLNHGPMSDGRWYLGAYSLDYCVYPGVHILRPYAGA